MARDSDIPETPVVLQCASQIVAAYVSNNPLAAEDLPGMIESVHNVLLNLELDSAETDQSSAPAIDIDDSITDDYLICLEDGKKLKMLKRYLRSRYGLSPEEYRAKWGLPADYPMVAPNYAAQRSKLAKKIGLGQNGAPKKARPRK
ncbi:MAG: MucR family transcriptional regulator [Parvibaculaceae bacterium]